MWKHEILASLQWQDSLHLKDSYGILLKSLIPALEEAPNIHIEDARSLSSARNILEEDEPYIFMDNGELMRCPFPRTLFTFRPPEDLIPGNDRMAVYVTHDGDGIWTTSFFYNPPSRGWAIFPFTYACTAYSDAVAQLYDPSRYMSWPLERKTGEELTLRLMYVVHATLYTLNAKNVYLEAVERPEKCNKKRAKNKKVPLYRYHVLKVAPGVVRKTSQHESAQPVTGSMPVHLCRGHFRTYTEDAPLFGIPGNFGRFWIQAHVRGHKENGVVVKDYELQG